jgi:NADPH:quinone reductase-like Zn-dependent oxidoreductase
MKSITVKQAGGIEELKIQEVADLTPKAGWLTIDVAYAGVGFVDVLLRKGEFSSITPFPVTPGLEVSGYVREVGNGVEGFYVGQPVASLTLLDVGGYASQAYVRPELTVPLDNLGAEIDLSTAAAAIVNATTAYLAVKEIHNMKQGDQILVHGATGGLGSFLGQIAKHYGASKVWGTVGNKKKTKLASDLGYDELFVRAEFVEKILGITGQKGVDAVYDTIGGETQRKSLEVLRMFGHLIALGNASGQKVNYTNTDLWFTNKSITGFMLGGLSAVDPKRVGQAAKRALQLLAKKQILTEIYGIYPLEQVADAHLLLEGKETVGKLLLEI